MRKANMVIVTAADHLYFNRLSHMIGAAQYCAFDILKEIMVFDIGLTRDEYNTLARSPKVRMCRVELVNKYILQPVQSHPHASTPIARQRTVIGAYSWKPVAIYQALREHERVLWVDAGVTLLQPGPIWNHLITTGYFLLAIHDIGWMSTNKVREKFKTDSDVLGAAGHAAGLMGWTRKYSEQVISKAYECARDIDLFIDDGTAGGGLNCGRHDQPIFSILSYRAGLKPLVCPEFTLCDGRQYRITEDRNDVRNPKTLAYIGRSDTSFGRQHRFH